jgi:hypothetical protein
MVVKFHYGKWQNDQVIRVFHKEVLKVGRERFMKVQFIRAMFVN